MTAAVVRKEVFTKFLEVKTSPNGWSSVATQYWAETVSAGQRKGSPLYEDKARSSKRGGVLADEKPAGDAGRVTPLIGAICTNQATRADPLPVRG